MVAFVGVSSFAGLGASPRAVATGARRPSVGRSVAARRAVLRMADDDMSAAQTCVEDGCEPLAVQDILARLGSKRDGLKSELAAIESVMGKLATANLEEDRSLVADIMTAAIAIFSKSEDTFPKTGIPSPWTMDKPKKK